MRNDIEGTLRNVKKADVPNSTFAKVDNVLQTLKQRKDDENIRPKRMKPAVIAAAAAAMLLITTTALAAWYFLTPSEVASLFDDHTLSAAFESESAILMNESVTAGDYTFTLLGVVSGESITEWPVYDEDNQLVGRTYAVLAIQYSDGRPLSLEDSWSSDIIISPLIRGIEPWKANVFTLSGRGATKVVDGIAYRIVDCDDVSIFAEYGLYLGIWTNALAPNDAFLYDERTGEISSNLDYDGISVVFDLPLDKSLADPEKAERFIANIDSRHANNGVRSNGNAVSDNENDAVPIDDNEVPETEWIDEARDAFSGIDWDDAVIVTDTIMDLPPSGISSPRGDVYFFEWSSDEYGEVRTAVAQSDFDESVEPPYVIVIKKEGIVDGVIKWAVRFEKDENEIVKGMIVVPKQE